MFVSFSRKEVGSNGKAIPGLPALAGKMATAWPMLWRCLMKSGVDEVGICLSELREERFVLT
jgi:hypothetical protein